MVEVLFLTTGLVNYKLRVLGLIPSTAQIEIN
jgi:hypothetical protein